LREHPDYADDMRRVEAYKKDCPEDLIEWYVQYYKVPLGNARLGLRCISKKFDDFLYDVGDVTRKVFGTSACYMRPLY